MAVSREIRGQLGQILRRSKDDLFRLSQVRFKAGLVQEAYCRSLFRIILKEGKLCREFLVSVMGLEVSTGEWNLTEKML